MSTERVSPNKGRHGVNTLSAAAAANNAKKPLNSELFHSRTVMVECGKSSVPFRFFLKLLYMIVTHNISKMAGKDEEKNMAAESQYGSRCVQNVGQING